MEFRLKKTRCACGAISCTVSMSIVVSSSKPVFFPTSVRLNGGRLLVGGEGGEVALQEAAALHEDHRLPLAVVSLLGQREGVVGPQQLDAGQPARRDGERRSARRRSGWCRRRPPHHTRRSARRRDGRRRRPPAPPGSGSRRSTDGSRGRRRGERRRRSPSAARETTAPRAPTRRAHWVRQAGRAAARSRTKKDTDLAWVGPRRTPGLPARAGRRAAAADGPCPAQPWWQHPPRRWRHMHAPPHPCCLVPPHGCYRAVRRLQPPPGRVPHTA